MKKKEYIEPAMEHHTIVMRQQLLAGSLTDVTTTGLDDEDPEAPPFVFDHTPKMPWEMAW